METLETEKYNIMSCPWIEKTDEEIEWEKAEDRQVERDIDRACGK